MEAAACYVGECRGGARDAKIALTAEGLFGMFIYIMTPLMFVAVLGLLLTSADPLTLYVTYTNHIFGPGSWEQWFVGVPLILALALSVLNAIMGVGRSLYQAAEDGLLPRWFQHKNRHGVPDYAMGFNVVCSMILVLLGSPLRIYIISNGGYLLSCSLAFLGYFIYRHLRPDTPRLFRLPTVAKWFALAVFIGWTAIYFFGGWNSPKIILNNPKQGPGLYLLGLLIVALYAPLYWWRAWQDRRLAAAGHGPAGAAVGAVTASPIGTGGTERDGESAPVPGGSPASEPVAEAASQADPVADTEPSGEPPVVR
jgi:amino acid transporter